MGFLGRLSYEMARSPLTALYARHLGAPTQAPGVVTTLGPTPVAPYRPVPAAPPAGALRAGASLTAKGTAA